MSKRWLTLAWLVLALAPVAASAQSDVLLRLRSGSPPGDRFVVDSAGGVVARGDLGIGIIPASGCGERMLWYPFKAAFRAGGVDATGCTYWNDPNVGFFSWAGGYNSRASGHYSFAFGYEVTASGESAVGLGRLTTANGLGSVAIGVNSTANGTGSVAIGANATADANFAVALGYRASANGRAGSFTWADASSTDSLENSANNSFQIRAAGGVALFTNSTATTGVSLNPGGAAWNVVSDRARKEDFAPVDGEEVLALLRGVPVTSWRYLDEDPAVRHIGPMAQDWHRTFGLAPDSLTINSGDFDGVNIAAIQALERRTRELLAELQGVRADRDALRLEIASLNERLARLEALLARAP